MVVRTPALAELRPDGALCAGVPAWRAAVCAVAPGRELPQPPRAALAARSASGVMPTDHLIDPAA